MMNKKEKLQNISMKTTRDYFNYLIKTYPKLAKSDVYEILEEILKRSYVEIVTDFDYSLTDEQKQKMNKAMEQLNTDYPLPYITKRKAFYHSNFYVNEDVLIPRADSEVLVEQALNFINEYYLKTKAVVYDICTGSGCVGLSIKRERSNIDLYLSDISTPAIRVASENALLLSAQNVNFLTGDFLKPFKNKTIPRANLITCNPPYIAIGDSDVDDSVEQYEPHLALYAKDNGLYYYEQMAKNFYKLIDTNNKFMILMEFGYTQKDDIESIFNKNIKKGTKIEFVKDNSDNWRVIKIFN